MPSPKPLWLLPLISVALVFIATNRYGVGLSGDSACYLSAGINFAHGQGLVMYNHFPLVAYAPVVPLVLAGFESLHAEPLEAARYLNLICLCLTLVLGLRFVFTSVKDSRLQKLTAFWLIVSVPLIFVTQNLWSEAMFVLEVTVALQLASRFIKQPSWQHLIWLSLATSLLWMTRYSGLGIYCAFSAMVFFFPWQRSWPKKATQTIVFMSLAGAANFLWMIRNTQVTGFATGERKLHFTPIWDHFAELSYTLTTWYTPFPHQWLFPFFSGLIFFFLIVREIWRRRFDQDIEWSRYLPHFWFVLGFSTFSLVSVSFVEIDPLNNRLAAPLYLSVTFILSYFIKPDFLLKKIAWPVILVTTIHPTLTVLAQVKRAVTEGTYFYAFPVFQNSPLKPWLNEHPLMGPIFSNSPEATYFLTRLSSQDSPRSDSRYQPEWDQALSQSTKIYYVYFQNEPRPQRLTPAQFAEKYMVTTLVEFSDGGVYQVALKAHP